MDPKIAKRLVGLGITNAIVTATLIMFIGLGYIKTLKEDYPEEEPARLPASEELTDAEKELLEAERKRLEIAKFFQPKLYQLEPFEINLVSANGDPTDRYIRVAIAYDMIIDTRNLRDRNAWLLAKKIPAMRNAVLDVLTDMKPHELPDVEKRDALKAELIKKMNEYAGINTVVGLYITSLTVGD